MKILKLLILIVIYCIMFYYGVNFELDAALKEQEFRDNLRASRCERMDDIERNVMRGYCND